MEELISRREAARRLGVAPNTVLKAIEDGRLRAISRSDGTMYVLAASVDTLLSARTSLGRAETEHYRNRLETLESRVTRLEQRLSKLDPTHNNSNEGDKS